MFFCSLCHLKAPLELKLEDQDPYLCKDIYMNNQSK